MSAPIYVLSVLVLMIVAPLVSIGAERFLSHNPMPVMLLVGKWFVFWSGGVRLFFAGLKQFFQPRFTAEEIFGIGSDEPLPFIRELGAANFATGTAGMLSLGRPSFVLPIAIVTAIFCGLAGIRHLTDRKRTKTQNLAMITGILVSLILAGYIAEVVSGL